MTAAGVPSCAAIELETGSPGAANFSAELATLAVCAPPPPPCEDGAKYLRVASPRVGVDCGDATPPEREQTTGFGGDGGCCQETSSAPPFPLLLVLVLLLRPRRSPTTARCPRR